MNPNENGPSTSLTPADHILMQARIELKTILPRLALSETLLPKVKTAVDRLYLAKSADAGETRTPAEIFNDVLLAVCQASMVQLELSFPISTWSS